MMIGPLVQISWYPASEKNNIRLNPSGCMIGLIIGPVKYEKISLF